MEAEDQLHQDSLLCLYTKLQSHKAEADHQDSGTPAGKDENPVYLGVKLDTTLTLKDYMKDIKKKANNHLKLLKRLASTSWGADKAMLKQLYMGYVHSIMEYTLSIQSFS